KACVLPENPASYRVVRTKSYLFNKASSPSPMAACKILAKVSLLLRYLVMTCLIPPVGVTKAISQ
ncbi:hypothetical protein, partial [Escherichia coli]|uniref:hypothetical protein n=1 Tax=Escherichia coli TaxID=562 RepID=UPI0032DB9895